MAWRDPFDDFPAFFSNGNVSAAKILTKYGSLPLYREDLMPLTVERPSFYDDPPLWTIRLRNQPQGLLAPETGFYRPIYGIMRRRTLSSHGTALLPPQSATFLRLWGPRKSSHFWCASPSLQRHAPSVRLPLFLQDRGLSKFLSLNLESQSRMGNSGGSFRRKCPAYDYNKDNLSQFGTSHWAGPIARKGRWKDEAFPA